MFILNQSKNQIILKRNTTFLGIGIVATFMAIMGIKMLCELLPFEPNYAYEDILGLIFMCIWTLIVSGMALFAFITNSKKITINDSGIFCNTLFTRKNIKWSEIQDWGLSYCGQTRFEGNTYYLYFSKIIHPIKNTCKKKLKGKMIKTFVIGSDYTDVVNKIVPFCKERVDIAPFIGEDKYHFL